MNNPTLDAAMVQREVENLMLAYPDLREDEQLRSDMIEGSTAAFDVLDRIVAQAQDAAAMAAGVKALIDGLQKRKSAAERREEAMRALALRIMEAASLAKVTLPRATLSVRQAAPSVRIIDEAAIPADFWRVKRELDNAAIKTALQDKFPVPGAELSNGGTGLTVRVA